MYGHKSTIQTAINGNFPQSLQTIALIRTSKYATTTFSVPLQLIVNYQSSRFRQYHLSKIEGQ
jgi:hypothetical protein